LQPIVEFPSCWCFGYCSFFLVVQTSVRFPNLSLVVDFWSAASFRYAKGCLVVVDLVSGWLDIFHLCEERRYNGPEGGVEKVFVVVLVVVDFVACFGLFMFEVDRFALLVQLFSVLWIWHRNNGETSFWKGLGVCSGGSWVEGCLIDLCRGSGGPITFDSRLGASFFDSSSFRLFWCLLRHIGSWVVVESGRLKQQIMVDCFIELYCGIGKLTMLLIFRWVFWCIFIFLFLFGVILGI